MHIHTPTTRRDTMIPESWFSWLMVHILTMVFISSTFSEAWELNLLCSKNVRNHPFKTLVFYGGRGVPIANICQLERGRGLRNANVCNFQFFLLNYCIEYYFFSIKSLHKILDFCHLKKNCCIRQNADIFFWGRWAFCWNANGFNKRGGGVKNCKNLPTS